MDEQADEWIPLRQAVVEVAKAYADFMLCEPAAALHTAREAIFRSLNNTAVEARASKWIMKISSEDVGQEDWRQSEKGEVIPSYFWGIYMNAETVIAEDWVAGEYTFSWDGKMPEERESETGSSEATEYAFGLAQGIEVTRRGLPLIGNRPPTDETAFLEAARLRHAGPERRGRPQKWRWEDALCAIISKANTPDGLPAGHGAQAEISRMLSQWFRDNQDGEPASSEIGARAAKIMAAIGANRK